MGRPRRARLLFFSLLLVANAIISLEFICWDSKPTFWKGRLYAYELQAYDILCQTAGAQPTLDERLRIVGVEDSSLATIGPWPWLRELHGALVDTLREGGAAVAAFDFLFDADKPDDDNDIPLANALSRFKRGVLASTSGQSKEMHGVGGEEAILPNQALLSAAAGVGFINVNISDAQYDPKVRRTSLAVENPFYNPKASTAAPPATPQEWLERQRWVFSWDLVTYVVAKGMRPSDIAVESRFIRVGDERIPTNADHEILINYYSETRTRGMSSASLDAIPYWRALGRPPPEGWEGQRLPLAPDLIKDGIFLVGIWASTVTGDNVETPLGRNPGIWVHAQIVNTLLSRRFLQESPRWVDYLLLLVLPLTLAWAFQRVNGVWVMVIAFAVTAALGGSAVWLFGHGWWIRVVGPGVAVFTTALIVVLHQFIRSHMLLRQFITPELAHDLLLAEGAGAHTSEEDCTVIFSDIRGFTTLNEQMAPSHMVALLKEYHSLTVPIYERHGGRCLDYLGDAQMVVYGDPMSQKRAKEKNHAVAALGAAIEVHEAIEAMNERWKERGDPPFDVGIGACSGIVAVGVLGADTAHLQYTVIGDVTNTAARVQGLSRELSAPVICTQSTIERAGDRVVAEEIKTVSLKGKSRDVTVYRVLGLTSDPKSVARMRAQTREPAATALGAALGLAAILSTGCAAPAAPLGASSPSPVTSRAAVAVASVAPVGAPEPVQTLSPAKRATTRPIPSASHASSAGPRVSYATPPPPVRAAPAPPSPAVPLLASPLATADDSLLAGFTFPLYPDAVKASQMRQPIPQADHIIVVLDARARLEDVKAWYKTRVKPSAIVERGTRGADDYKVEMSKSGGRVSNSDLLDTIILQPGSAGGTRIVLAQWVSPSP